MTTKRVFSASVPLNGKLWVTGGDQNRLPSTEYVSPNGDASQPGPDLPSARAGHCAVKLSTGKVMLLGGGYGNLNGIGKSVIIFDPDTETFDISLQSLKTHRFNFGCAVFKSAMHDNREVVLAVGGLFRATAEVWDYTQLNAEWTEIAKLPTDHVDDQLLAVRAVTSESGQGAIIQYNQELYELNCETSGFSWRILPQKVSPGLLGAVMMTLPPDYAC